MDAMQHEDHELPSARILRHGFVWFLVAFSAAGGMLQGYAIGLGSTMRASHAFHAAFPGIWDSEYESMSINVEALVFLLCAATAASPPVAATVCDRFGRKTAILASSVLAMGCAAAMAAVPPKSNLALYVFRGGGGLAVGVISVAVPLYQSEVAPAPIRGRLLGTYQLAYTLGILCAFVTLYFVAQLSHPSRWRLLPALQAATPPAPRRLTRLARHLLLCLGRPPQRGRGRWERDCRWDVTASGDPSCNPDRWGGGRGRRR